MDVPLQKYAVISLKDHVLGTLMQCNGFSDIIHYFLTLHLLY